ncbi:hypothetical protein RB195_019229 [Necator americanus]|uniref:BPL/LPL catalytic domain-containing protein n=1 Tax=Necator americanus TaxID=51031 RepID=A0ABR1CE84_NECAM
MKAKLTVFVSASISRVYNGRPFYRSPRRRFRSCTADPRKTENAFSCLFPEFRIQVPQFLDQCRSLPPFYRIPEPAYRSIPSSIRKPPIAMESRTTAMEDATSDNSAEISPSITIEEIDRNSDDNRTCDGSTTDFPYVDDSDVATSPRPIMEFPSQVAQIIQRDKPQLEVEAEKYVDEFVMDLIESQPNEASSLTNGKQPDEQLVEQTSVSRNEHIPKPSSQPPKMPNGMSSFKRNGKQTVLPPVTKMTRRRHSAMVGRGVEQIGDSFRFRSLSPVPFGGAARIRHSMCETTLADRSFFTGDSFRRPYTPTRKFHTTTDRSLRAMYKPPSILVYTGEQTGLYKRIRSSLSQLIPADRYTVFHLSAEAMKKQPWIEPTTACLIIADTSELDDQSWGNMQTYFNQSGKIIFVCQNRLLASLSNCESSKKQADMIRMAFGSRDCLSMGKDFEHFLKKSLKTLSKQGQINTTFHSKDLAGGMSYSVVLNKVKDMPLFLYMENSAHQASAIFSDATSEQLLAPGSRILHDSLSRVGVTVCETEIPTLTPAVMIASEDDIIENLMGVRYGEEIGLVPRLFLRKTEKVGEQGMPDVTESVLPVEVSSRNQKSSYTHFNFPLYFSHLRTRRLGHVILHIPVATTTMDVCESLCDAIPTCDGAVIVAARQTHGQGRGGNEFVSPLGAAMFTVSTSLPQSCSLARTPSFVQHVFAVALVDAIRRLSGFGDFPLRIKWPNDFYFNRSHKVGGLLATAKCRDDGLLVSIGAGINVSNSQPTVCLNDMVPDGSDIKFSIEEVIAETLNRFEYWMNIYEMKGAGEVLKAYHEFWLHSREEVLLEELSEKVVIRGLDKNGYLQVRSKSNPSKIFSVGDNGNTFDMMKGLIRHKLR